MANVLDVANLFLSLAEKQSNSGLGDLMTDMKLQKMLYFAQCWHLVRHGEPLFNNRIEAWQHGPVVPDAYAIYKEYGCDPIRADAVEYDAFTSDELETIWDVFHYYGMYSASGLREISHRPGTPWAAVYKAGENHIVIPEESMKDYYSRQQPLETFADRMNGKIANSEIEVITPRRNADGVAILEPEEYDDWEDEDDN